MNFVTIDKNTDIDLLFEQMVDGEDIFMENNNQTPINEDEELSPEIIEYLIQLNNWTKDNT
jgi:hypothetical protein